MNDDDFDIRRARPDDYHKSCLLLTAAGLPVEDLTIDHLEGFLVAEQATGVIGLIGLIGLEVFGQVGLLRSLVVHPGRRGLGLGQALVDALETQAVAQGLGELWLLTIDADQFFDRLGFVAASRASAPESIVRTPEFSDLCPEGAVLMKKRVSDASK